MTRSRSPRERRRLAIAAAIVGLAVVGTLLFVYAFRAAFSPLLLALAVAYILEPIVQKVQGRSGSRRRAVNLIFCLGVSIFLAATFELFRRGAQLVAFIRRQIEFLEDPATASQLRAALLEATNDVLDFFGAADGEIAKRIEGFMEAEQLQLLVVRTGTVLGAILEHLMAVVDTFGVLLLFPFYLYYLMLGLPGIWERIRVNLPAPDRARTMRVLSEVHEGMSAFLRGRVVVAVLKGVVTAIGLWFVGTQFAVLVGLAAGLLSILPFVGAILGFIAAFGMTIAAGGGVWALVGVVVVFIVAEVFEGFVLIPRIMERGLSLHPLTVLFSIVLWSYALGVFGALVAIPLTVIEKILLRAYVLPSIRALAHADDEPPEAVDQLPRGGPDVSGA